MKDRSKNEGRVQKWRTGPKNGGRAQKWRAHPEEPTHARNAVHMIVEFRYLPTIYSSLLNISTYLNMIEEQSAAIRTSLSPTGTPSVTVQDFPSIVVLSRKTRRTFMKVRRTSQGNYRVLTAEVRRTFDGTGSSSRRPDGPDGLGGLPAAKW